MSFHLKISGLKLCVAVRQTGREKEGTGEEGLPRVELLHLCPVVHFCPYLKTLLSSSYSTVLRSGLKDLYGWRLAVANAHFCYS